jgi:hypothetical protein
LILGIALGLWGIVQWIAGVSFGGDVGVRSGVSYAPGASGQLQGGLFGFPVAIVLATAALTSSAPRSTASKYALGGILALNGVSLLLTYERTFWLATAFGCLVVIIRSGRAQRLRALAWTVAIVVATVAVMAVAAPGTLTSARERITSVGQYGSDDSVRYRLVESQHVIAAVSRDPIAGSGLGASIYWGQPWEQVPPTHRSYSHDGYLWAAWKLGVPAAALLFALLIVSAVSRPPPMGDAMALALRKGAQAAVIALLVVNVTFPVVNSLSITGMLGVLLAMCLMPVPPTEALRGVHRRSLGSVPAPSPDDSVTV